MLTLGAVLFTISCSGPQPSIDSSSSVLQSVSVNLAGDGAITAIDGTAVYLDEVKGESLGTTTSYETRTVADDLPVRITTQYKTADSSGSDLNDVAGYTGRVELNVTVENLTVKPTDVEYDVAGQSRVDAALVGTPMSIAASAQFAGTRPSDIVVSADDGGSQTNGIVSATANGDAVVQWAALLAPPQSQATTTFQLVANVTDFAVPSIDIAMQAGLHTDLSYEGALGSAFDNGPTSELGLQQRTITLISEVNAVLNRAGTTITEVRTNLDDTSKTLGVRTAQQLHDSSESLATTMKSLGEQLGDLQTDLSATATGTETSVSAQLRETVESMKNILGDTSGTPSSQVEGTGCAATVRAPEAGYSIYSAFVQLSARLAGYATANEGCRDEIVVDLQNTVGPRVPSVETCTESSMTCALFGSSLVVTGALLQLVVNGEAIVSDLNTDDIDTAISQQATLANNVADLSEALALLPRVTDEPELATAVQSAQTSLEAATAQVSALSRTLRSTATGSLTELGEDSGVGPLPAGSMIAQLDTLAESICSLSTDGVSVVDPEVVEKLRAYLTSTPCTTGAVVAPPAGYPTPLADRLQAQVDAWKGIQDAGDTANPTSTVSLLSGALAGIQTSLDDIRSATVTHDEAFDLSVDALAALAQDSVTQSTELGAQLGVIRGQQLTLADSVMQSFTDAAVSTNALVSTTINEQVRVVSDRAELGRGSLVASYNSTISGLSSTSQTVITDARGLIDTQKSRLTESNRAATADLSEQTASALERIAASTSASSRDVEAASTLLSDNLNKVLLDLGDQKVAGSGLLGAMAVSAAKADTADFQLALASQNAAGYANIRSGDVAGILLQQAQFAASLKAANTFPAFHLKVPSGATSHTIYSFHLGGEK
ncbi:hypothetical protein GCM10022198_14580 [Klugiella xanthotipulae]